MCNITRVGVYLTKNLNHDYVVNTTGRVITNRAVKREKFLAWCADLPPGYMVEVVACNGAHH